uniref:Uncharacterized protein n=1 Tax=Glossina austeni TaxID=7395 RepID=A0A1A9UM83_GLOAU
MVSIGGLVGVRCEEDGQKWNRSDLVKKLTNISEECSDLKLDAISFELSSENATVHNQSEAFGTADNDEESTTDDENVINKPRKRGRNVDIARQLNTAFMELEYKAHAARQHGFEVKHSI